MTMNCDITECLRDAGCDEKTIHDFNEAPSADLKVRVLIRHRNKVLECMHKEQERMACLDYLIYELRKGGESDENDPKSNI